MRVPIIHLTGTTDGRHLPHGGLGVTRETSPPSGAGRRRAVPAVYAAAILVSSALLFWLELMFAKMILPVLGGSPMVWTTCLFFFQGMLLAGYAYADASLRRLPPSRQAALHLPVVFAAALVLPVAVPRGWTPPQSSQPVLPMLLMMASALGPLVFALSATAPVLQRWFLSARSGGSTDPYVLYAASNLGALGGLLLFPLLIEPRLDLPVQSRLWAAAYLVWAGVLMTGCALRLRRPAGAPSEVGRDAGREPEAQGQAGAGPASGRGRWVLLSFVPASLLYGVTAHLTAEIAAVPLLWVVPLALYLLSFVLTFARRPWPPHRLTAAAFPFLAVLLAPAFFRPGVGITFFLPHLVLLFSASLYCHGELAGSRPPAGRLTAFYLCVAFGGLLAGAFNTLVAPLIFTATTAEYPLVAALAFGIPAARQGATRGAHGSWPSRSLVLLPAAALAVLLLLADSGRPAWLRQLWGRVDLVLAALAACLVLRRNAVRFGSAVGAVLLSAYLLGQRHVDVLHRERNFYGTLAVVGSGTVHVLARGTTSHGAQDLRPGTRGRPLTYYTEEGPLGDYFRVFAPALAGKRIAAVGLGVGSVAAYGQPGQEITFYEIDPAVERIARDGRYFTFLADSAAEVRVVLGDARLRLAEAPEGRYALIVLDAFTSDAIPVHLLTREALATYRRALEKGGAVLVHFSNRNLALEPLLAGLARDAGAACLVKQDREEVSRRGVPMKNASSWGVIAGGPAVLEPLRRTPGWVPPDSRAAVVWTDARSSLLGLIR